MTNNEITLRHELFTCINIDAKQTQVSIANDKITIWIKLHSERATTSWFIGIISYKQNGDSIINKIVTIFLTTILPKFARGLFQIPSYPHHERLQLYLNLSHTIKDWNYISTHHITLDQWFPTRGPRAKSGPPSLKIWPAALDKIKK